MKQIGAKRTHTHTNNVRIVMERNHICVRQTKQKTKQKQKETH